MPPIPSLSHRPGWGRSAALLATLLAGGCVGPDFDRPAAPDAHGFTAAPLPPETVSADTPGGAAQRFAPGRDIPADWWSLFHSDGLDRLVRRALEANPTLQAAEAALKAAHETTEAERGGWFPSLAAGFGSNRTKTPSSVSATSTASSALSNLHTAQLTMTYSPDVWGGTWRQVETQEAQEEAQRFQFEAASLTLTANVVSAAINEAMLRGQIAAQREIAASLRESLTIQRRMLALGQLAGADIAAQEAALAQAEAILPPLEKQLAIQRDALCALLGDRPDQPPEDIFDLATLHLPEEVPVSLPSRLVEQRPDIRQAEANLHAASAAVGIAIANRLPLINLTAGIGSVSALLTGSDSGYSPQKRGLFTSGTGFWSLAAGASVPLFDGFALMHRQHAAEALHQQAEAQYRATVIAAFQNVADSLEALKSDAESVRAATAAEKAADDSLAIVRRQLELGSVAPLALLNAQQTVQQARAARIQAVANRFADTAALFQALGGGWWTRTPDRIGSTRNPDERLG